MVVMLGMLIIRNVLLWVRLFVELFVGLLLWIMMICDFCVGLFYLSVCLCLLKWGLVCMFSVI